MSVETAARWLSTWDRQQETYIPGREARFDFITALVAAAGGPTARVLDLGCGPGSLLLRLRRRLPDALLVGVDVDPVLLDIAATLVAPGDPNTTLLDADLRRRAWVTMAAEFGPYDAVVTCTALHWLSGNEIARTYTAAHTLLRGGGLIVNADTMPLSDNPALASVLDAAFGSVGDSSAWTGWWQRLRSEQGYEPQFAERARRQRAHPRATEFIAGTRWHQDTMRAAGFDEAATVWRTGNEAIVAGRRPTVRKRGS